MLAVERGKGGGTPPTLAAFIRTLQTGGYVHAQAVYDRMHGANPAFVVDENWCNQYGNALLGSGRAKEAAPILRLGTKMAPASSWIADSLAEAYDAVGERQLAIAEYRRALAIEPTLGHAIDRLKALGAEAAAKAAGG